MSFFFRTRIKATRVKNQARNITSSIKPQVTLTAEHRAMIDAIATVMVDKPELGRTMRNAFVDICNEETHP